MSKKSSSVRSPPIVRQAVPESHTEPWCRTGVAVTTSNVGVAEVPLAVCAYCTVQSVRQLLLTPSPSPLTPVRPSHGAVRSASVAPYQTTATRPGAPAISHGNMLLCWSPRSTATGVLQLETSWPSDREKKMRLACMSVPPRVPGAVVSPVQAR